MNITFGEYQGVYENIDEVDIKNVFLKNAAAGHRRPEFRRFSHLKLMMSVMLGSGALACKYFLDLLRYLKFFSKVYRVRVPLLAWPGRRPSSFPRTSSGRNRRNLPTPLALPALREN